MKAIARLTLFVCLFAATSVVATPVPAPTNAAEELQRVDGEVGRYGGRLGIGPRSETQTLNPVTAPHAAFREVIGPVTADLIALNRASQQTQPGFAKAW